VRIVSKQGLKSFQNIHELRLGVLDQMLDREFWSEMSMQELGGMKGVLRSPELIQLTTIKPPEIVHSPFQELDSIGAFDVMLGDMISQPSSTFSEHCSVNPFYQLLSIEFSSKTSQTPLTHHIIYHNNLHKSLEGDQVEKEEDPEEETQFVLTQSVLNGLGRHMATYLHLHTLLLPPDHSSSRFDLNLHFSICGGLCDLVERFIISVLILALSLPQSPSQSPPPLSHLSGLQKMKLVVGRMLAVDQSDTKYNETNEEVSLGEDVGSIALFQLMERYLNGKVQTSKTSSKSPLDNSKIDNDEKEGRDRLSRRLSRKFLKSILKNDDDVEGEDNENNNQFDIGLNGSKSEESTPSISPPPTTNSSTNPFENDDETKIEETNPFYTPDSTYDFNLHQSFSLQALSCLSTFPPTRMMRVERG